eukprot:jgi/Botrbrau1/21653/Bobra.43_1s0053.2
MVLCECFVIGSWKTISYLKLKAEWTSNIALVLIDEPIFENVHISIEPHRAVKLYARLDRRECSCQFVGFWWVSVHNGADPFLLRRGYCIGDFYGDVPKIKGVGVTLDVDMDAPLNCPTWKDGYFHFQGIPYDSALAVIIDIRTVIPGSGTSSPSGWAALPVFEPGTRFVASGYYQLPLFQGLPAQALLREMAEAETVDVALATAVKAGRLKLSPSNASVFVRLMDDQRAGHFEERADATSCVKPFLRLPSYAQNQPRLLAELRRDMPCSRTYDMVRAQEQCHRRSGLQQFRGRLLRCHCRSRGIRTRCE